jgi:hypothetical protein
MNESQDNLGSPRPNLNTRFKNWLTKNMYVLSLDVTAFSTIVILMNLFLHLEKALEIILLAGSLAAVVLVFLAKLKLTPNMERRPNILVFVALLLNLGSVILS